MEMTEVEIIESYKNAEKPKKQVGILAELNDCDKKDIVEILYRNGCLTKLQIYRYQKSGLLPAEEVNEDVYEQAVEAVTEIAVGPEKVTDKSDDAALRERIYDLEERVDVLAAENCELLDRIEDMKANYDIDSLCEKDEKIEKLKKKLYYAEGEIEFYRDELNTAQSINVGYLNILSAVYALLEDEQKGDFADIIQCEITDAKIHRYEERIKELAKKLDAYENAKL